MIRIIERTDKDIEQETIELYEQCQPYLKQGIPLTTAIREVKGIRKSTNFMGQAWYRRLREYAKTQGYKMKR